MYIYVCVHVWLHVRIVTVHCWEFNERREQPLHTYMHLMHICTYKRVHIYAPSTCFKHSIYLLKFMKEIEPNALVNYLHYYTYFTVKC